MANNISDNIQEWLKLSNQGLFVEAKSFYFNNLFDEIIERFVERTASAKRCDVLFSILGSTPEPIILTQRVLLPKFHVIFTSNKNQDYDNSSEITAFLEKYLTSKYKIVDLKENSHETIYNNMRAQMNLFTCSKCVIDVTGSEKSMAASAAIFAKDYNCDVVYVDYDEYVQALHRPMPGTEKLCVVYSAIDNLLDTIDFTSFGVVKQEDGEKLSHSIVENIRCDFDKKQLVSKPTTASKKDHDNAFKDSFNKTFLYFVDEKKGNRGLWLPKNMSLSLSSERTIVLKHDKSGETLSLQRAQLFGFYRRYKLGVGDAHQFFDASSRKSKIFNSAIYSLLNAINYELFKERI